MIKFKTAPILKGKFTIRDFLNNEGTFNFKTDKESINKAGFFFTLVDDTNSENFIFSLSIQNQSIVFQRNNIVSVLTLEDVPDGKPLTIFVMWNYTELILICRYGSNEQDEKKATVKTNPITPPNTLIKWARKQNLLPLEEYDSEEDFRNKVHSCLQSIQDKINESGSYSQFWNLTYEGKKIIERKPKNEIEVQPIIHCLLSDQFLMSTIEIIPEFNGSVGNLDFLFIAKLKEQGFAYFCAEFKNAHSNKLEHGLQVQLPTYMENKKARYGAYCVLDYRGEYYDEPNMEENSLDIDLDNKILENPPFIDRIRNFIYKLSKPISASKK